MAYLTYGFCAMTVLWLVYLLVRSMKLRIPERLGVRPAKSIPELCVEGVMVGTLLHDRTAGECAFINELRRHQPLLDIPAPGRKRK